MRILLLIIGATISFASAAQFSSKKAEKLYDKLDPQKEELDHRIKAAKGMADNTPEAMKSRISNKLRRSYQSNSRSNKSSTKRSTTV